MLYLSLCKKKRKQNENVPITDQYRARDKYDTCISRLSLALFVKLDKDKRIACPSYDIW
jgi:hypothetical protein